MLTMRKCSKCGEEKDETRFSRRSGKNSKYFQSWCKECTVIYQQSRTINGVEIKIYRKKYMQNYALSIKGRAVLLRNKAQARARQRGDKCELSLELLMKRLENNRCEKTGIEFEWSNDNKEMSRNPKGPSIDKIDPYGSYTDDNIQLVCVWYNLAKAQLTDAEMLDFCQITVEFNSRSRNNEF